MAHVFVLDSRARRARIQTLPSTYLSDVLQQGCAKLGLKPDQFVLKQVNHRRSRPLLT
jgi:tether containing UBX domain for GLUT4